MNERYQPNTEPGETPAKRPKVEREAYDHHTAETESSELRVREVINSFDEKVLRDIFEEYFKKAGSDPATMNFVSFDKIRIIDREEKFEDDDFNELDYGCYEPSTGIKLYSDQKILQNPEMVLWALVHEEMHAISDLGLREKESQLLANNLSEHEQKIGLERGLYIKYNGEVAGGERFFMPVNEGMTDLITGLICREYLARAGQHPTFDNTDLAVRDFDLYTETDYGRYRRNAEMYIDFISILSDIPEDTVRNSVIRTYLRNGEILPKDLTGLIGEHRMDFLLKILKVLNNPNAQRLVTVLRESLVEEDFTKEEQRCIEDVIEKNKDRFFARREEKDELVAKKAAKQELQERE